MNITKLYEDHNIPHATEGEKNNQSGWINITCPFCDDQSNHLGYNISSDYYHCWRCGSHPVQKTIARLLHMSEKEAKVVIKQYGGKTYTKEPEVTIRTKSHKFPSGVGMMKSNHRKYLKKRGFDPDELERDWTLFGTGPVSLLDGVDYKHRIMVPIYWNGQQVSFQARDISDRHNLKYMACPKDRELVHHKHILYGRQEMWRDVGICVEGVTDVWRFGNQAFCTFGIEYTQRQIREMAKAFKRIFVVFDDEPQAVRQANKLVNELKFRGLAAERIEIFGDPGDMSQVDANYLIKTLVS